MNVYEIGRVILRLRILYPDARDAEYENGFTVAPTESWEKPPPRTDGRASSKRAGCTFQHEATVPDLDQTETAFFEFLKSNAEHLQHCPQGCLVLVEYYCYMAEPRFLVQLSGEYVKLLSTINAELCVETYTRDK